MRCREREDICLRHQVSVLHKNTVLKSLTILVDSSSAETPEERCARAGEAQRTSSTTSASAHTGAVHDCPGCPNGRSGTGRSPCSNGARSLRGSGGRKSSTSRCAQTAASTCAMRGLTSCRDSSSSGWCSDVRLGDGWGEGSRPSPGSKLRRNRWARATLQCGMSALL